MSEKNPMQFAWVRARQRAKLEAQATMLAGTILSGISVGLVGSGARVVVVGPRADEVMEMARKYAEEFLHGLD